MGERKRRAAALLLAVPLVLAAACSNNDNNATSSSSGGGTARNYTFAVVTHGAAGDAFWSVVKAGAEQAGKDEGVKVTYQSDGDPQNQSQLIDAAVSQKVDGLVVSMANPDALKEAIGKAVQAGIPVVTINSGQDKSAEFGALEHVGQDETVAGRGAGGKLKEAGVTHLLCVVHEAGNIGLDQRCRGAALGIGSGKLDRLQVDGNDLQSAQATVKAKLQADKSIDGVLALNPGVGAVTVDAVSEAGSSAKVATFDLNADVVKAVQDGKILFAVDQQQYLQGYLPIVFLTLYKANLNTVGGGLPVLTGPGYVTKDNAAQVADLATKGTR
jgi:simple sugar transport system substrate-binding protein